ncbi:MAG: hypothetical protein R3D71_01200 [Rickettsiales bacterium]
MNKSFITNFIALLITVGGYFSPVYSEIIMMTGLFALSGGITNWIAIYMLFEKVPFLYGSGVIPKRFDEFKAGIKQLIIQEFFAREHIERFFQQVSGNSAEIISDKIDFERVFSSIVEAIEESPLGGMLGMLGGKSALEPLKEPVIKKLKEIVTELAAGGNKKDSGDQAGNDFTSSLISQVEKIIDNRLSELTPQKVKEIIQNMIRKHLGWLVVWGGVFGGLIGFVVSISEMGVFQ